MLTNLFAQIVELTATVLPTVLPTVQLKCLKYISTTFFSNSFVRVDGFKHSLGCFSDCCRLYNYQYKNLF